MNPISTELAVPNVVMPGEETLAWVEGLHTLLKSLAENMGKADLESLLPACDQLRSQADALTARLLAGTAYVPHPDNLTRSQQMSGMQRELRFCRAMLRRWRRRIFLLGHVDALRIRTVSEPLESTAE